jgi:hypothetical protein
MEGLSCVAVNHADDGGSWAVRPNSTESGGSLNHVNDGDGSGFAIVTSTMEAEAQSRIDDGEQGDALDLRHLPLRLQGGSCRDQRQQRVHEQDTHSSPYLRFKKHSTHQRHFIPKHLGARLTCQSRATTPPSPGCSSSP